MQPIPTDGFVAFYAEKLALVLAGSLTIPNAAVGSLPAAPASTDLTDTQLVAAWHPTVSPWWT